MDFKNNSNNTKSNQIKREIIINREINELDLEKEKTKQLELIKEIKKLELKLMTNKKYKHPKKYIDLSSILNNNINNINNINDKNEESDTNSEIYDTISIQSTKSITTINYVDLLS